MNESTLGLINCFGLKFVFVIILAELGVNVVVVVVANTAVTVAVLLVSFFATVQKMPFLSGSG